MRYIFFLPIFLIISAFTPSKEFKVESSHSAPSIVNEEWNLTLKDINGNMVSLSDLKGKFLVVDLWASWCPPCIQEMEHTKELQKSFAEGDKIEWVFISFDKSEAAWRKAVKKYDLKGIHLYGTPQKEEMKKELKIKGIPRYVWIDADGKILQHDAPRPSENSAKRQLKYYVNKL